jgi:phage host-nuclease inhibitor protein Gam
LKEKTSLEQRLDEMKIQLARLQDEHQATLTALQTEVSTLQKRVEEYTYYRTETERLTSELNCCCNENALLKQEQDKLRKVT